MSRVPDRATTGLHFPVGSQTCSQWLCHIMDRVGIEPKYKGGSVRMAIAFKAIDRGVPIDVVLNTGRWASWQVFNKFYNRARLRAVALSIGLTSLAYSPFDTHMTDVCQRPSATWGVLPFELKRGKGATP